MTQLASNASSRSVLVGLLVYGCDMLQVSDSHEGFVKVVQLQDTGQQEEARDQDTGEELGQSKHLQTNGCQPVDNGRGGGARLHRYHFSFRMTYFSFLH